MSDEASMEVTHTEFMRWQNRIKELEAERFNSAARIEELEDQAFRVTTERNNLQVERDALARENERLRVLLSIIIDVWDWWQEDSRKRSVGVVHDAITAARVATKGET